MDNETQVDNQNQVDEKIQVFSKDSNGNKKIIKILPTATLKELKDAINKAFQVEFKLFVFGGKHLTELKDGQTLESLGIKDS